jgi:HSP20 family protein
VKEVDTMNAISLWRPSRSLLSVSDPLDRFFDGWFSRPRRLWLVPAWSEGLVVDLYIEDGNLVVKAEVPGVTAEDLEVTVKDNVLTIAGETSAQEEVEEENYIRRERRYGSFCRSLTLPAEAKGEKAEAAFEDGVLTVTIPVAEEPREDTVKVEVKAS